MGFHGPSSDGEMEYVHTPTDERLFKEKSTDFVEVILPDRLAGMIVDAGLVNWVLTKIR